jgi:hypothetical protein
MNDQCRYCGGRGDYHTPQCVQPINNQLLATRLRMIVTSPAYMDHKTRTHHLLEAARRLETQPTEGQLL